MNRRSFLKALFSLPVVAALPALWLKAKTLAGWKVWYEARVLNEGWVCIVHPSVEHDLRIIEAKQNWDMAYRAYRRAGRPVASSPNEILAKFLPKTESYSISESGSYHGIRFIESKFI